jgi:hypothetical protein
MHEHNVHDARAEKWFLIFLSGARTGASVWVHDSRGNPSAEFSSGLMALPMHDLQVSKGKQH